jgi:hypothetical protein
MLLRQPHGYIVGDSYFCPLSAAPVSGIPFGRLRASGIRPVPKPFLNAGRLIVTQADLDECRAITQRQAHRIALVHPLVVRRSDSCGGHHQFL